MAYLFLKNIHNFEGIYNAISEDKIETLNLFETYDQYGQQTGSDNAGDYFIIQTEDGAEYANNAKIELDKDAEPDFSIGNTISAFDDSKLFQKLVDEIGEEDEDIFMSRETVKGFNYWDGHNNRTVCVSGEGANYEIEDDETIVERLNEAIENKEFENEGNGLRIYLHKDARIVVSQFSGSWEDCAITLNNDFEDETQD